jgi:hypothetical protein
MLRTIHDAARNTYHLPQLLVARNSSHECVAYKIGGGCSQSFSHIPLKAGLGDKYFAVPWEALQLDRPKKKILLDVTKKDLKKAPGFDKNNWPNLDEQRVIIYEIYEVPLPDDQKSQDKTKPAK